MRLTIQQKSFILIETAFVLFTVLLLVLTSYFVGITFQIAAIASILTLVLGSAVAYFIASQISAPIIKIQTMAKRLSELDFSYKLDLVSTDEFGDINRDLNRIADELEDAIETLQDADLFAKQDIDELEVLSQQLKDKSQIDPLTKIVNRPGIDNALNILTRRTRKSGSSFSMIMFDIDNFKSVNSSYGHQAGDEILMDMAAIIKMNLRGFDMAGRWGGETFVVILPDTVLNDAVVMAERLRHEIELHHFTQDIVRTASFGVSEFTKNESMENLIQKCKDALNQAKSIGKNLVISL
jgi:diguanylate cyclase (GGDEF)-like protein